MKARHEEAAVELGHLALRGVGEEALERVDWGNAGGVHVVHVRRPVTSIEETLLPIWFNESKPRDGAGPVRPLRSKR